MVIFPGASAQKIVVGAHFDGWDVGQGAVDNGIGSAILFDVARLLKRYSPANDLTVEGVWVNGEEVGLVGSKKYVEMHYKDSIVAMINMDTTGSPTSFSAGGTDALVPFLERIAKALNGFSISPSIGNSAGTNSDHQPFMLHGIPTIAVWGKLDPDMVSHYHDLGDSFDKVSKRYLSDAAAVASVLAREMANSPVRTAPPPPAKPSSSCRSRGSRTVCANRRNGSSTDAGAAAPSLPRRCVPVVADHRTVSLEISVLTISARSA
ncbi:MAG: Zn-dependent exopeptidase M28 [Ignavibacteria bacterium]|nr:Zn-dependent exopeptidase M28 [Ignavibacteria bacterium]